MRINTNDLTLKRNYLEKYRFLIREYESVKDKTHPRFRYAKEFYETHGIDRRSFLKYYNRYKQSGKSEDLIPRKRGPRYRTRRPLPLIEHKVKELREKGNNRYEIVEILRPKLKKHTPSPSGVYNILKRLNMNVLTPAMRKNRRKIIKEKIGELGHIDCHYLSKNVIEGSNKRLYLVCLVDDCSRMAYADIVKDIKSITVMFSTMQLLKVMKEWYNIQFEEILSDNGPEFGTRASKKKEHHPFERMLQELGIKHRYTRPYRPQTNGKVERFWRTIEEDMLRGTSYDSEESLRKELEEYLYYYNHLRPHQGINGKIPYDLLQEKLSSN